VIVSNRSSGLKTTLLLDGLAFPESPRWREDKLWFSDMYDRRVMTVDLNGRVESVCTVPQQPSGLGWLPDGRMLVVSMLDRRLMCLGPAGLTAFADLSDLAPSQCNDMVVDQQGRAYIGNFGFNFFDEPPKPTVLILVTPDGQKRIVADGLMFPNGAVITGDGTTLIVGESYASRLTAFTIRPDGSLTDRRVWAELQRATPDGICLDAGGAIWIASPGSSEVLRVCEGGRVTHRIPLETQPVACMLGGPDRQMLFILEAPVIRPGKGLARKPGRIETVRVEIPGAGLP
jgi:sugar lactone lactonase YvrE